MNEEEINTEIRKIVPEFEKPTCPLVGEDGNAFAIMGRVSRALKRAYSEQGKELTDLYVKNATSGNYDHLLATTLLFVEDDDDSDDDNSEEE